MKKELSKKEVFLKNLVRGSIVRSLIKSDKERGQDDKINKVIIITPHHLHASRSLAAASRTMAMMWSWWDGSILGCMGRLKIP